MAHSRGAQHPSPARRRTQSCTWLRVLQPPLAARQAAEAAPTLGTPLCTEASYRSRGEHECQDLTRGSNSSSSRCPATDVNTMSTCEHKTLLACSLVCLGTRSVQPQRRLPHSPGVMAGMMAAMKGRAGRAEGLQRRECGNGGGPPLPGRQPAVRRSGDCRGHAPGRIPAEYTGTHKSCSRWHCMSNRGAGSGVRNEVGARSSEHA